MRQTKTMNVSLSPALRTVVAARIATGRFSSASEIVRAALRLIEEDERRQAAPQPRSNGSAQRRGGGF
ncbi:type II toxin-antitoxin system ParD family antitoxin [Methylobacterium nigriterrae]|uniref:type II toxin-antitoxin system ParD family antitoxin n=1 Tax=Methylobacterium nigriterrae TaxID=3127512 RepID=UPI0030138EBB